MSQFTPEQEKEFEFRLRYEQEQAAKEAPANQDQEDKQAIVEKARTIGMPVGAAVGAGTQLAGKVADIGRAMTGGEYVAPGFYGRGAPPVERYGRSQNLPGKWLGGGSYEQAAERIGRAFPVGGPIAGDAAIIAQLEKEALQQMAPTRRAAEKIATSVPAPVRGLLTSPFGFIGKGLAGAGAGMQAGEAAGRYSTGDVPGAVISGLGSLGAAAAMIPHPIARIGGTAVSLGAEGLNAYLDYLRRKNDPKAPKMAEGGLAKKKMSKAERAAHHLNNMKKAAGGQIAMKEGGHTTAAWQRKEGKNPEGGLNAVGRASYKRETGGTLKAPVSAEAAKKSPKKAARRKSFCARMSGNPGPMKDEKGRPTRKALALRKWDC